MVTLIVIQFTVLKQIVPSSLAAFFPQEKNTMDSALLDSYFSNSNIKELTEEEYNAVHVTMPPLSPIDITISTQQVV